MKMSSTHKTKQMEMYECAIKALEERPTGDLISHEALKEVIKANQYLLSEKNKLYCPNKRPTGKWVEHSDYDTAIRYGCNVCGSLNNEKSVYCPRCGSRMIGDNND